MSTDATTPPQIIITILHKRAEGMTFDLEYFLKTHILLAAEHWRPYGLLGATITEGPNDSEYAYIVSISFKSADGWQKAVADPSIGVIMQDVSKFTNGKPEFLVGKVVEGGIISV